MNRQFPFKHFNEYCLRTPSLPLNFYSVLMESEDIQAKIKETLTDPFINQALYLASPILHGQAQLWVRDEIKDVKKQNRIKNSLLKYLVRMSTRCTPFGLFARCSVGHINKETRIENHSSIERITRYDMHFLSLLSNHIASLPGIKSQLNFFSNSTLYRIGDRYRYVEYIYLDGKRQHNLESVLHSHYLEGLLDLAKNGATIDRLINHLKKSKINEKEAFSYINELIENQILISELGPTVTGPDFLEILIKKISGFVNNEEAARILDELKTLLLDLDSQRTSEFKGYKAAIEYISSLKIDFQPQYLFQTDLYNTFKNNTIGISTVEKIKDAIIFLNRFNSEVKIDNLEKFKSAYKKRYDAQKIPLLQVLDIESGIGYGQYEVETTSFLDDIVYPEVHVSKTKKSIELTDIDIFFNEKLQKAIKAGNQSIQLCENDFKDFKDSWENIPDTLSVLGQLFVENGKEKIYFEYAGASANRLLARFAYRENAFTNLVSEIAKKEDELNTNAIIAEIVHIPEARTGNILRRPQLRDYEIPCLGFSSRPIDKQIPLQDLLISIEGDEVVLISKSLGKRVIPKLSNAHNYEQNPFPVYHFLCDLQFQNQRDYWFSWGAIGKKMPFLPRVIYKDIVLFKARWKIKKKDFQHIIETTRLSNEFALRTKVLEWKEHIGLPNKVQLVESDNTLWVDFQSLTSIQMLFDYIKNKDAIELCEVLYSDKQIVKDENQYHTNEFVFSFYKQKTVI